MSFAFLVSFWMKFSLEPSTNSKRSSSAGRVLRISGEPILVSTAIIHGVERNDRANATVSRAVPSRTAEVQQERHDRGGDACSDASGTTTNRVAHSTPRRYFVTFGRRTALHVQVQKRAFWKN